MSDLTPATTRIVVVEWEDITDIDNWNEEDGPFQPTSCKSLGWLLENNSKWITIARDYDVTNDKWASVLIVPKMEPTVINLKVEYQDG